jgi:indole-3-acetate monooxygenase
LKHFNDTIIQVIREQAAAIETSGKLPADALQYIYEHRLFKLFLPETLGGRELPLPEAVEIFEEASQIDGSFGWLVTIGSGGDFFSAYLSEEIASELFSPDNAVIAGSGGITGLAKPTDGGYLVNGQWQYCSGAHHATIFTGNCRIEANSGKKEEVLSFTFLPEQVTILEDWRAFGMKGTGSHSIKVENAFVPFNRTFDLQQAPRISDYKIYRYPFFQFAEVSFAAVALGVAGHFLQEAFKSLEENRTRRKDASPERYEFIRKKFEDAHNRVNQVRTEFYVAVNTSWNELETTGQLTEAMQHLVSKSSKKVARITTAVVHEILPFLGMAAVTETSLLNQLFRDLHTVCQHTVLVSYED